MLRLLWSILVLAMLGAQPARAQNDFLQPEQAFRLTVSNEGGGQVRLNWAISEGYYL